MPNTPKMSLTLRLPPKRRELMRLPSLLLSSIRTMKVGNLPMSRHLRPSKTSMTTRVARRGDGDSTGRKSKSAEATMPEPTSSRKSTIHKICFLRTNALLELISLQRSPHTILRTKSSKQRSSSLSGLRPGSSLLMSDHPQWLSSLVHTTSASTRVSPSHSLLSNSRAPSIDQHLGSPQSME